LQSSPNKRSKGDEVSSLAVLTCPDCGEEFANVDQLEEHIR
jgi:hypothetical protein